MRRRILHIILVAFALVSLGAVWFLTSPQFAIRRIEIYGLESLSEDDILKKLPFARGDNLLLISTDEAQRRLMADARIDSVSVSKSFPDGVVIEVHEKKPVYLLNCGRLWGVSRDGVAIPIDNPREIPSLPIIVSNDNYIPTAYHEIVDSNIVKVVVFLNRIWEKDPNFLDSISEVYSPMSGEYDLVLTGSGIVVRMSEDNDVFDELGIIISNLDTDTISPYEIDLRFPGQGIVRFKPRKREVQRSMEMGNG